MGIYPCNECGELIDEDLDGCKEDPKDGLESICPDCFEKLYDEDGEELARKEGWNGF